MIWLNSKGTEMGGETEGGRERERELVLAVAERRRTLIRYRVRDSAVSRPFRKLNHPPHTLSLSLSLSLFLSFSIDVYDPETDISLSLSPLLLRAFHALFKAIRVKPGKGDGEANRGRFRTSLRISKIGIEKEGGEGKIEPTRFFFFPSIERGRGTRVGDPTRHLTPRPKRESRPPPPFPSSCFGDTRRVSFRAISQSGRGRRKREGKGDF